MSNELPRPRMINQVTEHDHPIRFVASFYKYRLLKTNICTRNHRGHTEKYTSHDGHRSRNSKFGLTPLQYNVEEGPNLCRCQTFKILVKPKTTKHNVEI